MSNGISIQGNLIPGASMNDKFVFWVFRKWFPIMLFFMGLFVGIPFFAPLFMKLGWIQPANAIYSVYSFLCHQLPQRSFFFFGSKTMYSLSEIQSVWQNTTDPLILRQYIGTSNIGWKVAWSDRMVSMYTSIPVFAWVWYLLRHRLKQLSLGGLILLSLPMVIDGGSHFISDFAGIGQGFRDSNAWLAALTNHQFAPNFYAGDALGSFNSWMRLITGTLFGLGIAWFAFPTIEVIFGDLANILEKKFRRLESLKRDALEAISSK